MRSASPSSPAFAAKSIGEVATMAKATPGSIHFASGGNGSPQHMAMEMYKAAAGIDIVHVPYKGAAQALTDVVGGQVPLIAQGIGVISSQAKAGKVRVLAVTGPKRSPLLPDVPTMAESGIRASTSRPGSPWSRPRARRARSSIASTPRS
jgi:tripartite-type tricarboxylate transporter receptor subunit TctC